MLWADHGFHLGTKERWGKRSLWEPSTRIPLMFHIPGMTGGQR
jgi:arylsulfatase A-like enzyme